MGRAAHLAHRFSLLPASLQCSELGVLRDALDLSMALRVVHRHAVPHGVGHVNRAPIGRDSRFVRMGSTGATFSDGHFLRLAACHVDELNAVLVLVQHNQSVLCHVSPPFSSPPILQDPLRPASQVSHLSHTHPSTDAQAPGSEAAGRSLRSWTSPRARALSASGPARASCRRDELPHTLPFQYATWTDGTLLRHHRSRLDV